MNASPPTSVDPIGFDDEPPTVDALAQLLAILSILRRRWLIVTLSTALGLAGAAVAIQLLEPRWRATASIVLHMSGPQVLDKIKGVTEDAEARISGYREYYETQRTIMRSRTVAVRALERLGLGTDPTFLGIEQYDDPERQAEAVAAVDPVEKLRERISVEEVRDSRVVEISAEYTDPSIARDIANAVADAYIDYVHRSRNRIEDSAKENIASERGQALARLRAAEKALETFKSTHAITSISLADRQNVITQDILTLSTRTKEAEAERIRLDRLLAQVQALHAKHNLAASTLIPEERESLFEALRKAQLEAKATFTTVDIEYGPKHEEHRKAKERLELIDRTIEREANDLVESFAARRDAARAIERDLQQALQREHNKALELGGLERNYRELEREAQVAADEYLLIARRDTEIAMTNRVEDDGIEVLDRATTPTEPFFPRTAMLLGLGLVAGFGLGTVGAVSADLRDQRLRGLMDLERVLAGFGVPVLGQLPLIPPDNRLGLGNARAQRRRRDLYAHLFPQSLMAERCRGIRTSLAFVQGTEPAKTIMITSPSSAEGKSSTSMNLALSFCQAGKRVLVVDADMRRPRLHQMFTAHDDSAGLAGLLAGTTDLESTIHPAPADEAPEQLFLLPSGGVPDNPAELLDSPSLPRVLAELKQRFDMVVIDTPPVLPVTDAVLLATHADGVILVSRCEQTTRSELQRALAALARSDANILGVVLNEVDARREQYDYTGSYYTYRSQD